MRRKYLIIPLICLFAVGVIWFIKQSSPSQTESQKSIARSTQSIAPVDITEIESFNDIRSELERADRNTFVIFDVDDVLITYYAK